MELYVHSSVDLSWGCACRLYDEWTLAYPEYSTTSNAVMKTAQASNSDSQATAEVEESSLPNCPVPQGLAAEEGGPNITTPAVGSERGINRDYNRIPDSMDSDPGLEDLVRKISQHYVSY